MNHEIDEKESLITELSERISNGVLKENPTFVLLLGMCPTLAVTTSSINGLGMGVTTMVVLALSNLFISLLRKVIPNKIRIPAFIVIIASFVTIVELLLNAYIPSLYKALGLYIPLIVVNCIILGRAEAYAYSHTPLLSLFDGIGMGMGFTLALTIIGSVRELIGAGSVFNVRVMPTGYIPVSIFIMAPGAFFVLAILTAIQNKVKEIGERNGKDMSKIQSGCGGNCLSCDKECKVVLDKPMEDSEEAIDTAEPANDVSEVQTPVKEETVESIVKEAPVKEIKTEEVKPEPVAETVIENSADEAAPLEENSAEKISKTEKLPEEAPKKPKKSVKKKVEKPEATEEIKEPVKKVEEKPETVEPSEIKTETAAEEKPEATDDELELIDFSDYRKAIQKSAPTGKKPVRKRASMEKAQAMLNKAEGKKEEQND